MLSSVLSKSDCASCKFCCSFRRQSLWETPLFDAATTEVLRAQYPHARFRPVGAHSFTIDLQESYKSDDAEEEAPCPFLDSVTGCILDAKLKPFDCSIWPLRAVRRASGDVVVALTPTCPAINKVPQERIAALVESGLGARILAYAEAHPDMIKENADFFTFL